MVEINNKSQYKSRRHNFLMVKRARIFNYFIFDPTQQLKSLTFNATYDKKSFCIFVIRCNALTDK